MAIFAAWPTCTEPESACEYVHVNAQTIGLRDAVEQRGAFGHERPGIHVALRDDAVERRADFEVTLHFGEPRKVGFGNTDVAPATFTAFSSDCTFDF